MGTLVLAGATSGSATLTPVDAVTAVITLPSATATLATLGTPSFTTGIGIGAATAGAGGVAFPATAVAVANVNTLDDYEEYDAPSTACTGAITTACTYKVVKVGRMVTFTIPSVTGAGVATAAVTLGVTLPAKFRPSGNEVNNLVARITNNGSTAAETGLVNVLASGVINIYRSTLTPNYTVTATAGFDGFSMSWVV